MRRSHSIALLSIAAGLDVLLKAPPKDGPHDPHEDNTYNLPQGDPIARELQRWFRRQMKDMLGVLATIGAEIPTYLPDLANYNDPMASAMTPLVSAYWDQGGKQVRERLGLDPDDWEVTNPHTRKMIEDAAFDFCESTNATTSKELNHALASLRQELTAGIVSEGETLIKLTRRVQSVFEHAEEWRAWRIAATETSRAVHAAELQSAVESGVVAGLEWLVSADACPLCQKVAAEVRMVPLGQPFAISGHNPNYQNVRHPPLHPGCQCSLIEVLKPEYGGLQNPQWGATLVQPTADEDYRPPEGVPVAKPRPDAR